MKRSLIVWIVIIAIVATLGVAYARSDKNETNSTKQEFIEKWNKVGELKYIEIESEKQRDQAKKQKDQLLQELNGTGLN